jgi:hypothetical protein
MERLAEMPPELPVCALFRRYQWSEVTCCVRFGREYPPNVYLGLDLLGVEDYDFSAVSNYLAEQIDDDEPVRP